MFAKCRRIVQKSGGSLHCHVYIDTKMFRKCRQEIFSCKMPISRICLGKLDRICAKMFAKMHKWWHNVRKKLFQHMTLLRTQKLAKMFMMFARKPTNVCKRNGLNQNVLKLMKEIKQEIFSCKMLISRVCLGKLDRICAKMFAKMHK